MSPDNRPHRMFRRAVWHLLVLMACALLLACGGGGDAPAGTSVADNAGAAGADGAGTVVAGGVGSGGTGLGSGGTDVAGGVGSGGTGLGGGGGMAGGVGSGGSGLAEGGVSGYGSLIVDGRSYDNGQAQVVRENAAGGFDPATTAIGQQVRLTLSSPSSTTVTQVEVMPQLIGPVTATLAGDLLRVLDQPVRVAPSTVLANHASAAAIGQNLEVEVHGHWVPDAGGGHVLEATRIATRAAPAEVLLGGVVHEVQGQVLRLNGAAGLRLQVPSVPAGLGAGSPVAAWVSRAAWDARALLGSNPLDALRLRSAPPSPVEGDARTVSGPVWDSSAGRISLQGLELPWPDSLPVARPASGAFALVSIKRQGGAWQVVGTPTVSTSGAAGLTGGNVSLSDTLDAVTWNYGGITDLTLRGTPVRVPATMSCTAIPGRVAVRVEATLGPLPLAVTSLHCDAVPDAPVNTTPGATGGSPSGTGSGSAGGSGGTGGTGGTGGAGVTEPGSTQEQAPTPP